MEMENDITLAAVSLFNSGREPWYKNFRRKKEADTLGHVKHPTHGDFEIQLVPDWYQIKESYLPYEDGKTPYNIMMVIRQPDFIFRKGFVVRLGTVLIAKSDEVDGNEQELLESIMSEPEIKDGLDRQFKIM